MHGLHIPGWTLTLTVLAASACAFAAESAPTWGGTWYTNWGVFELEQRAERLAGARAEGQSGARLTASGTVKGTACDLVLEGDGAPWRGRLEMATERGTFNGTLEREGSVSSVITGVHSDPRAVKGPKVPVAGLWLTDLGYLDLSAASGGKVEGRYALRGTSTVSGRQTGLRLDLRFQGFRSGDAWFELAGDGASFRGASMVDGSDAWFPWSGRRAGGLDAPSLDALQLAAGKTRHTVTQNLLGLHVRAPDEYDRRRAKTRRWPAVLILHGSNMSAAAYVDTLAAMNPEQAGKYFLIGIDGETPSSFDPPAFNYTYTDFVGKSTFQGYPGTDRQSPALIAEAIVALRDALPIGQVFVGGHSQGGFLTYSLLMNFSELFAGAFPISGGVIFQCEPSAYVDPDVMAAQRRTPLAIIHAADDEVVEPIMGRYAHQIFLEAGFPALRFSGEAGAGHRFALLPVWDAITWLTEMSAEDPELLVERAEERITAAAERDAYALVARARLLDERGKLRTRIAALQERLDALAAAAAATLAPLVAANADGQWIDAYLDFDQRFGCSSHAAALRSAYMDIRKRHADSGESAYESATAAAARGDVNLARTEFQRLARDSYASRWYREARLWLSQHP